MDHRWRRAALGTFAVLAWVLRIGCEGSVYLVRQFEDGCCETIGQHFGNVHAIALLQECIPTILHLCASAHVNGVVAPQRSQPPPIINVQKCGRAECIFTTILFFRDPTWAIVATDLWNRKLCPTRVGVITTTQASGTHVSIILTYRPPGFHLRANTSLACRYVV